MPKDETTRIIQGQPKPTETNVTKRNREEMRDRKEKVNNIQNETERESKHKHETTQAIRKGKEKMYETKPLEGMRDNERGYEKKSKARGSTKKTK